MRKPKINKNRAVEFLQPFSNSQKGDIAVHSPVLAASLVAKGICKYAETPVKTEVAEQPKEEVKTKKSKKK